MAPFIVLPDLNCLTECRNLNGCETGKAKITRGYNLKAKHIIHTVGPVWHGGYSDEPALACIMLSDHVLQLPKKIRSRSIAFPGISTGAYGFPKELAATIAVNETRRFLNNNNYPEKVIFVAFSDDRL